mmetsp:Transcript_7376/g.20114  ORF Transcript_7376/g.20114 Transcript_7376/m.20114 type:complete len:209 (-) Transcript_7376:1435-2061(-)
MTGLTTRHLSQNLRHTSQYGAKRAGQPYHGRHERRAVRTTFSASHEPLSVTASSPAEEPEPPAPSPADKIRAWLMENREKSKAVKEKLVSYGPAAVLAYGLFDGVSYSIAFAIAFLGYEAQTGLNPVANLQDLVKICILMWAGNNVTRPFRLAGAAALAPFVDGVMEKLRVKLRLPSKLYSFFILTFLVATVCLSGVGLLIFSRWVQG